jgi:hypothetical protein
MSLRSRPALQRSDGIAAQKTRLAKQVQLASPPVNPMIEKPQVYVDSRIRVRRSTPNANKTIIAWPKDLAGYETLRKKLRKLESRCEVFHQWLVHNIVAVEVPTTDGGDLSGRLLYAIDNVNFITQSFISDTYLEKQTDITKLEVDMDSAQRGANRWLFNASKTVKSKRKLFKECSQKISLIVNSLGELLRELKTDAAYEQLRNRHSNLPILDILTARLAKQVQLASPPVNPMIEKPQVYVDS